MPLRHMHILYSHVQMFVLISQSWSPDYPHVTGIPMLLVSAIDLQGLSLSLTRTLSLLTLGVEE